MGRRARLLEDGACDAITKPFHPLDLIARLRLHLKVKKLQDEVLVKNATLARLTTIDQLTGLRSRRNVLEVLSIEVQRARRYGTPLSILMADLDGFKEVNDRFGHPAGDSVLQAVAKLLLGSLRTTDVSGRYGGDELVVVMSQIPAEGARVMADRWRAAVERLVLRAPDGSPIRTSLSIGIAGYTKGVAQPDELIAAADKALYTAKQKGRNRVEIFSPD
jgi:diguanylate cyclase (GGDEF)-like protein